MGAERAQERHTTRTERLHMERCRTAQAHGASVDRGVVSGQWPVTLCLALPYTRLRYHEVGDVSAFIWNSKTKQRRPKEHPARHASHGELARSDTGVGGFSSSQQR
eukprot:4426969-Prymnesium_polylepis.1